MSVDTDSKIEGSDMVFTYGQFRFQCWFWIREPIEKQEINGSSKIGWKSMREMNSQLLIEAIDNIKYTFRVGVIFVEAWHKNGHFYYRDKDICHISLIKYTLYFSLFTSYSYVHYLDTIFNV